MIPQGWGFSTINLSTIILKLTKNLKIQKKLRKIYLPGDMFLDVFIVHFQKDQKHKIDEIVSNEVGIAYVINDTIKNNVS